MGWLRSHIASAPKTFWQGRSRLQRGVLAAGVGLLLLTVGFNLAFPLPVDRLHPRASTVVEDRNGVMLRAFLAPDDMWRIQVEAGELSPYLEQAVLAYEDQYFYWHPGINPGSILQAAWDNVQAGRIVRGGSTITMQIARMIEPKGRTFGHKLVEAFRALQLEWRYSKRELLTLYFNLAPYGGNIVGVGAASHLYFNKPPANLSLGEAALLAALPNAPTRLRPDEHPEAATAAREKVLRRMLRQGSLPPSRFEAARTEPIPTERFAPPFRIPHLSTELVRRFPATERIVSTIELSVQQTAERIVENRIRPLRSRGVTNASAVVIENATNSVLAMVGSYDFFDQAHDGQVNGARAARSPGSALKPFVYALGFDQGLISPHTLMQDVPVDYAGYQPINYDESYRGAVTAEEALIRSLNVPAVNLYAQLKENGLYSFLKRAGIRTLTEARHHYGLSLVLGGCGVSLLELTNVYAGLANRGVFRPVRLVESDPKVPGERLFSEAATYLVTDILSRLKRPDLPAVWEWSINAPTIAWKTGTSYGHRDAWSIGFTPHYTIGVWAGNFDGQGAPLLIGADVAAPMMLALFEALQDPAGSPWYIQPRGVEKRRVCTVSGLPATDRCPSVRDELHVPGVSPNHSCGLHRLVQIDAETGRRLCSHCRPGRSYTERVFEFWPAEIATWRARNGFRLTPIPVHYEACPRVAAGEAPIIHSPVASTDYRIRPGVDVQYQKILLNASAPNETRSLFWFIDGELFHSGPPTDRVFLTPEQGTHTVVCVDEIGRSSEVRFTVR